MAFAFYLIAAILFLVGTIVSLIVPYRNVVTACISGGLFFWVLVALVNAWPG
jgi:hypothetical protein